MTAVVISSGSSPRKTIFDVVVVPGTPVILSPGGSHFNIVAAAPSGAGTYSIEYALTTDLGDWRPLKNGEAADNTALSNVGTLPARTSTVAPPSVQQLRFTAVANPTRFAAYGM